MMATEEEDTRPGQSDNPKAPLWVPRLGQEPELEMIARSPVGAALVLLAGESCFASSGDDERIEKALRVLYEIRGVFRSQSRGGDTWLDRVAGTLKPPSAARLRLEVLDFLEKTMAVKPELPREGGPMFVRVWLARSTGIEEFWKLTDDQILHAWKLHKPGKRTGATNHGIPYVAAALTLACGAFGDKVRRTESDTKTRNRIAQSFRVASGRAKKTL